MHRRLRWQRAERSPCSMTRIFGLDSQSQHFMPIACAAPEPCATGESALFQFSSFMVIPSSRTY